MIRGKSAIAPEANAIAATEAEVVPIIGKAWPTSYFGKLVARFPTGTMLIALLIPVVLSVVGLGVNTTISISQAHFTADRSPAALDAAAVDDITTQWQQISAYESGSPFAVFLDPPSTAIRQKASYRITLLFSLSCDGAAKPGDICDDLLSAPALNYIRAVEKAAQSVENYGALCWYNNMLGGSANANSPNCAPLNSLTQYYFASPLSVTPFFALDGASDVMQQADASMLSRLRINPKTTWYTDSSYATTGKTRALRSQIVLGTPINLGFSQQSVVSAVDKYVAAMYKAVHRVPRPANITLSVGGDRVIEARVLDATLREGALRVPIAVIIVLVIFFVQTRSVIISFMGTAQVLLTYLTTFSIFALSSDGKLPLLSLVSLFLVILWTMDGVMVIHSSFIHSGIMATSGRSNTLTVAQRVSYVLRKSVKGVITAHLCAMVCFAVNTMSPVKELHDFAVLMTIMILVSAYFFIFFTPAMVLFHHFYFSKRRRNLQRQREALLRTGMRERDVSMQRLLEDLEDLKALTGQVTYEKLVDLKESKERADKGRVDILTRTNFYAQSFASEWNVRVRGMNERDEVRRRALREEQEEGGDFAEHHEEPAAHSPQARENSPDSDAGGGEEAAPDLRVVRIQSKAFEEANAALDEFATIQEGGPTQALPTLVYSSIRHVSNAAVVHIPPHLLYRGPHNVDLARRIVTMRIGGATTVVAAAVPADSPTAPRARPAPAVDSDEDIELRPVAAVDGAQGWAGDVTTLAPPLLRLPVVDESDASLGDARVQSTDQLSRLEALALPFDRAWKTIAEDIEVLPGEGPTKEVIGMLAHRTMIPLCCGAEALDNVITRFDSPAQAGARIARTGFVDAAGDHQRLATGGDLNASHQVQQDDGEPPGCGPLGRWWHERGKVKRKWCCGRFGKRVDESREDKDRRLLGKRVKREGYGRMEVFFNNTYTTVLHRLRWPICVLFVILLGVCIFAVTNLEPVSAYVQLLEDDSNEGRFASASTQLAISDVPCDFCGGAYRDVGEYRKQTGATSNTCTAQGVPDSQLLNAYVDSCGVCMGSNSCTDCLGVAFGKNQLDACGQCLLSTSSLWNQCLTCDTNPALPSASCQICARNGRNINGGGPNCTVLCDDTTCPPGRGKCNRLTGICECFFSRELGFFVNTPTQTCGACASGFFPEYAANTATVACRLSCASNSTLPTPQCQSCSDSHQCNGCPNGYLGGGCATVDPTICKYGAWNAFTQRCTCTEGYTGPACQGQVACGGRGIYVSAAEGVYATCSCVGQWAGANCTYCRCANGGYCNENGTCTCPDGWSGAQCRTCAPSCAAHGACPVAWIPDQYPAIQCMGVYCTDIDLILGRVCAQCARTTQGFCASYQPPFTYYPSTAAMIAACNGDVNGYCFWNATDQNCFLQKNFAIGISSTNYICSSCVGYWSGPACAVCTAPAPYSCLVNGQTLACDGNLYSKGQTVPVVDACGLCGGDNSCVGCDGVIGSGLKFDACGVCGGNGVCGSSAVVDIDMYIGALGSAASANVGSPNYGKGYISNTLDLSNPVILLNWQGACRQIKAQTTGQFTRATIRKCVVQDYAIWLEDGANTAPYGFAAGFPPTGGTSGQRLAMLYGFLQSTNRLAEIAFNVNDPTAPNFKAVYAHLQIRAASVGATAEDKLFSMGRFQILTDSVGRALNTTNVMTSATWVTATTEQQSRSGMVWASCIGYFVFVTVINILTCSLAATVVAMIAVGFTVIASLAVFAASGFTMGAVEQLGVSLMIGLAVEHTVHIVDTYLDTIQGAQSHLFAKEVSRVQAVRTAMARSGTSILASGVATVLVALLYVDSAVQPFRRTAVIAIIVVAISIFTALVFVGAFLTMFGPTATYRIVTIAVTLMLHWAAAWCVVVFALYMAHVKAPDGTNAIP